MPHPEGTSYTHPSSPLYVPAPGDLPNYEPEASAVCERFWQVANALTGFADVAPHKLDAADIDLRERMDAELRAILAKPEYRTALRLSDDSDARKLGDML